MGNEKPTVQRSEEVSHDGTVVPPYQFNIALNDCAGQCRLCVSLSEIWQVQHRRVHVDLDVFVRRGVGWEVGPVCDFFEVVVIGRRDTRDGYA